jgi:hypothetical protein
MALPPKRPASPIARKPVPKPVGKAAGRDRKDSFGPPAPRKSRAGLYGVLISVGIVLVVAVVVILNLIGGSLFYTWFIGSPTAAVADPAIFQPMKVSFKVDTLVTVPSGSGAEATYNKMLTQAITASHGSVRELRAVVNELRGNPKNHPVFGPVVALGLEAANQGLAADSDLSLPDYPIAPTTATTMRDAIYSLGRLMTLAATWENNGGNKAGAVALDQAAILMGYRFFNQSRYVPTKSAGIGIMSEGMAGLKRIYERNNETDKAATIGTAHREVVELAKKWMSKERIVRMAKPEAGDLHALATRDMDLAWQREGLMWLGVAQWTCGGSMQRSAIQTFLDKTYQGSTSAELRQTAHEALTFVKEKVRDIPTD